MRPKHPDGSAGPISATVGHRLTAWLAAGALAFGLGAAMLSGAAAAAADTESSGSDSASSASSESPARDKRDTARGTARSAGTAKSATSAPTRAERPGALAEKRRAVRGATTVTDQPAVIVDDQDDQSPAQLPPTAPLPEGGTTPNQVAPAQESTAPAGGQSSTETEVSTATPRAGPHHEQAAATTAQPASPWSNIARHLKYIFRNVSPTLQPGGPAQQVTGTGVVGTVIGQSNNGFDLTYRIREQAKYGTVTVDPVTGKYTYIADDKFKAPGTVDYFVIEANNGTAAKLPGLAGLAQHVLHSLAVAFGLSRPATNRLQILVEFDGTGKYGTPLIARDYYVHQNDDDCAVMAVASVWGRLTGTLPTSTTETEFLDLVKRTPSIAHPGMMWVDEGTNGLTTPDIAQLLRVLGMDVQTYRMDEFEDDDADYRDGQDALGQLKEALVDGKGVITTVSAGSMWSALGQGDGSTMVTSNHAISVIGIDLMVPNPNEPGSYYAVVYVNDSGLAEPKGQAMAVPLATFMWAWAANGFELITATNPNPVVQQLAWALAA